MQKFLFQHQINSYKHITENLNIKLMVFIESKNLVFINNKTKPHIRF